MIYLFSWNNQIAIKTELQKWKDTFLEKYGDFNLFHIQNTRSLEKTQIQEILTSGSFFWDKKLILMEISPEEKEEENANNWRRDNFIEGILANIPEENIVVFYSTTLKENQSLFKKLSEIGKVVRFNREESEEGSIEFLSKKYPNLSRKNITHIVKSKGGNLEKSIQEIEKFLTYSEDISFEEISENTVPEIEESMFRLIDTILNQEVEQLHHIYKTIQQYTNFYYFYNTLLWSMRTTLYIEFLKEQKKGNKEIDEILKLGKKAFLIGKRQKLDYERIRDLYLKIINFDKKIKTGFTLWNQEEELYKELEIIIYITIFNPSKERKVEKFLF